jgi:hypothetical protein
MKRQFFFLLSFVVVLGLLGLGARPAAAQSFSYKAACNALTFTGTTVPGDWLDAALVYEGSHQVAEKWDVYADAAGNFSITVRAPGAVHGTVWGWLWSSNYGALFDQQISMGPCAGDWFSPGDDRVDPRPGDRVAAYCSADSVTVYGILDDGTGRFLATFKVADLVKAGATGIVKKVEPLGTVYVSLSGASSLYVRWTGGPADATGVGDFEKWVSCTFS